MEPARRAFIHMKETLRAKRYKPVELDRLIVPDPDKTVYEEMESYARLHEPDFVTLLLSAPSIRQVHPRYSIEVRYSSGETGKLYGHFGRNGKPLDTHAEQIQRRLFSDP